MNLSCRTPERVGETDQMNQLPIGGSSCGSGCLSSLGARSAASCSGEASCGDMSCVDRGVVVGEGEKSACDGGGGVLAGDVGVGEMWFGEGSRGGGGGASCSRSAGGEAD